MFEKYDKKTFAPLREQHNIMLLVGNGFYSSYLVTNIIHPHGIQGVPRSILYGVDIPDFNKGTSRTKRLVKSYWSRYDVNYNSYFKETKLFIMYGMSISKTGG